MESETCGKWVTIKILFAILSGQSVGKIAFPLTIKLETRKLGTEARKTILQNIVPTTTFLDYHGQVVSCNHTDFVQECLWLLKLDLLAKKQAIIISDFKFSRCIIQLIDISRLILNA